MNVANASSLFSWLTGILIDVLSVVYVVYLSICLFVYLSICLFVYLSICMLSICLVVISGLVYQFGQMEAIMWDASVRLVCPVVLTNPIDKNDEFCESLTAEHCTFVISGGHLLEIAIQ